MYAPAVRVRAGVLYHNCKTMSSVLLAHLYPPVHLLVYPQHTYTSQYTYLYTPRYIGDVVLPPTLPRRKNLRSECRVSRNFA